MKGPITFTVLVLACGLGGQAYAGPCDGTSFDTVIFRDDFDTVTPCNIPDPSKWVLNHPIPPEDPNGWWWVQGRTFFPNPLCDYECDPSFPHVVEVENDRDDRACAIEHYHYNPCDINPDDPNDPNHVKTTFLGGEIHSIMEFNPTQCYRFEARVCWPKGSSGEVPPRGLVTSFFTYGYDELNKDSDEIDFEYLSNEVFDPPRQVLTNIWNDSEQDPSQVVMPSPFDLTEWQTFRIYWCPDPCVRWTWIDPNGVEVVLREVTDPNWVPDEPMSVYFNFWAPNDDWEKAYDPSLQADQEDNGVKYEYWIDYVEVRIPEPAVCMLIATGTVWLLGRRSPTKR